MKFVIIRSNCGFGDRLITLTTAIQYSKITDRTIVIDWRDEIWCGNNQEYDFDYYYKVTLPNYIPLKQFLIMYEKNKSNLTVFPPYANVLSRPYNYKRNAYFDIAAYWDRDNLGYDINIFSDIIMNEREDIKQDVVIMYQYVTRPIVSLRYFSGIIMKDHLKKNINEDPFKINVLDKKIKYIAVHLRGTDRMNENSFKNGSSSPEEYTEMMYNKIDSDIKNVLLLSDTQILIDTFKIKYGDKFNIYYTNNKKSTNKIALHTQKCKNKIKVNIEMLKDFYFLLRAEAIYSDNISYFSMCPNIINKFCKCKTEEEVYSVVDYVNKIGKNLGITDDNRELRKKELKDNNFLY